MLSKYASFSHIKKKKSVTNIYNEHNICGQVSFPEKPVDASYQDVNGKLLVCE